jgi:serine/threonine protein kinase
LCEGNLPFDGCSIKDLYYNILNQPIENASLPDFVVKMLEKDKKQRITIEQLKQHPDFININWENLELEQIKSPHAPSVSSRTGKLPIIYHLVMNL